MAISATVVHSSAGGSGTTTYTTTSFTPTADTLLIVAVGQTTTSPAQPSWPALTGGGLTWNFLGYSAHSVANRRITLWAATIGSSPSAITLSFTWSGNAATNLGVAAVEISGHHATWPIAQIAKAFGTSSVPGVTLPRTERDANSRSLLFVAPSGNAPESSLVELHDANSVWIAKSDTAYDSIPAATVSYNYWSAMALEITDAASTPPHSLPVVMGLLFDLDAGAMTGVSDGNLAQTPWSDTAGRNNANLNAVATYRTNRTPTGRAAVEFTAAGNFALNDNGLFDFSTSAEIFAVVQGALGTSSQNAGPFQFGGNDWNYYTYSDGKIYDGAFTNTRYSFTIPVTPTDWHILNISHDGTTRVLRIDGATAHSIAVGYTKPNSATKSTIIIGGASTTTALRWRGDIAEILAYNRVLTDDERGDVYDFLYSRHINNAAINVDVPAAQAVVAAPTPTISPLQVQVPPAAIVVAAPVPNVGESVFNVDVPPAAAVVAAHPPDLIDATLTLGSPIDAAPLPTLRPAFTVLVTTDIAGTVEIQYDTSAEFTDPETLTAPAMIGQTVARVTARATADLTDATTYYWRARLNVGYADTDWTTAETFVISAVDGDAMIGGNWTVSDDTVAYPHLWYVTPARGTTGQQVVAVGTGFGTAPDVTLAGSPATVTDFDTVAASSAAHTDDRVIDAHADFTDSGHQRVTFIVPDVPPPGGPVYIEGS